MATVFETMMKIGFDNSIFGHLGKLAAELRLIHTVVGSIGTRIGGWGTAIGIIAGGAALGGMIKAVETLAKHGAEFNHQLNLMAIKGFDDKTMESARKLATRTSTKVLSSTPSMNLEHMNELMYVFGDFATMAPVFEKMATMNSALNSIKNGKGGKDAVFALAKTLEERHLSTNPEEFMEYAETMYKAVNASGGRVTPQDFQMAFKYGRLGALNWDQDFMTDYLPRMIQMMKSSGGSGGAGGGPGNALMSMYDVVVNGKMKKDARALWEEDGMLDENGRARGASVFQSNPGKWVEEELKPALAAKGITGDKAVIEEIGKLFGNRTASFIAGVTALQSGPGNEFSKDAKLNRQAMSAENTMKYMNEKDYDQIVANFHAQWKSFLETLGGPMMQPDGAIMKMLKTMTNMMASLNSFVTSNPEKAELIGKVLLGVAAGLAAFAVGAVLVGAAALAPGGAAALAIAGLAGALAAFAINDPGKASQLLNFIPILGHVKQMIELLSSISADGVMKTLNSITSFLSGLGTLVLDGLVSKIETLQNIFSKIKGLLGYLDLSQYMAKKVNYEGEGPHGSLLQNASFNTGKDQKQILQPIQIKLDLDGRTLGQAVAEIIEELNLFPTNGGSGNGVHTWDSAGQRLGA